MSLARFRLERELMRARFASSARAKTARAARAGAETVQVYVRWVAPGMLTPKLQLVNFEKIWLEAGEASTVELAIDARRMALLETPPPTPAGGKWVAPSWWVKPGKIDVFVGNGQPGYSQNGTSVLSGSFEVAGNPRAVTSCPAGGR